jgi:hypothetical protein
MVGELTRTLPNAKLLVLRVKAGTTASNCKENVPEELPWLAVRVAVC